MCYNKKKIIFYYKEWDYERTKQRTPDGGKGAVSGTWYEDNGLWYSNLIWKSYGCSWYETWSKNNYPSKHYGSGYYNTGSYSTYGNSRTPDINTVLCPYCDKEMELMMDGTDAYMCPECGTVYNDKDFEIYDIDSGCWISIIDINDFDDAMAV